MKSIVLPVETRATTSCNRKIIITWQDVKAWAGASQAIVPDSNPPGTFAINLPAFMQVGRWITNVVTPFVGGAATLSIGDDVGATRFVNAVDLTVAGMVQGGIGPFLMLIPDTIDVLAAGAGVGTLTAGVVEVYYDLVNTNDLVAPQ
jgi:hypothetical protein